MLDSLYSHFARRIVVYLWALAAVVICSRYFTLSINLSDSLPGTLFLVQKTITAPPAKGDLVVLRYQGGGPYKSGVQFLKRVTGLSGSVVSAKAVGAGYTDYFVDGLFVGRAKPKARSGDPLEAGPVGIIPAGRYYMAASSPDSFDSRYALVGWIAQEQIVGCAYRLF